MEAVTLGRTPPRSGPVQVGLVASLLVVAAGAWAVTGERMRGMDAGPGTELGGLGWFLGSYRGERTVGHGSPPGGGGDRGE